MPMSLRALKNPRNLQAALREATVKDIDEIIFKLQQIRDETAKQEAIAEERKRTLSENVNKAFSTLNQLNLTLDDLIESQGGQSRKGKLKYAPKYKYTDLDGIERTWSGQGRTPTPLKKLMESNGTVKEDYRIVDDSANAI